MWQSTGAKFPSSTWPHSVVFLWQSRQGGAGQERCELAWRISPNEKTYKGSGVLQNFIHNACFDGFLEVAGAETGWASS